MGPNPIRETERTQEDGGRDGVMLPPLRNPWGHQKLEEAKGQPGPEALDRGWP